MWEIDICGLRQISHAKAMLVAMAGRLKSLSASVEHTKLIALHGAGILELSLQKDFRNDAVDMGGG